MRLHSYWPTRFLPAPSGRPAGHVRRLLDQAVEEHLLSDVPVASFLSGGIDSSVVTALAVRRLGRRLRTFSVGFREPGFDETAVAAEVAQRWGTDHTRIELSEEQTQAYVREAVEKMDLPSVDAINTYIVARAVALQGVKVALSGLGGDELFGGYPSFRDAPWLALVARLPESAKRSLAWFGRNGRRLAGLPQGDTATVAAWRRCFWSAADLRDAGLPAGKLQVDLPEGLPDDFARISWVELSRYMRWMLLRDSDQMSMAVSLELRLPFLDHDLVEYVLGLPAKAKTGGRYPKRLLVEACRDLLPQAVFDRPKRGFALPMDAWMRGPLGAVVEEGLAAVAEMELLPRAWVQEVRLRFRNRRLHWTRLWTVVVLGHYAARLGTGPASPRAGTPSTALAGSLPAGAAVGRN